MRFKTFSTLVFFTIISFVILGCSKDSFQTEKELPENPNGLKSLFSENEYYYWYNGEKIQLNIDDSTMLVYDKDLDIDKIASIIDPFGLGITKTNLNYSVVSIKNNYSKFDFQSIGIFDLAPLLKIGETSLIPNGELVLQIKDNVSIESILELIKDDVKSYKKRKYNTFSIEIKQVSKVFSLSNKIYESTNLVEWCEPNFYADIKLNNQNDLLNN